MKKREDNKTDAQVEQDEPLHVKYRPTALRAVWGQRDVVASLDLLADSKNPGHVYLFTGPSGCGKTTLARILAKRFRCDSNILEVDAASNSGIDAMREVTSQLRYHGFGDTPNKAIIIDECHGLSKQAWQSMLKAIEEPPPHVFIFFCTTETGKVPETILTRCHSYTLKPLRFDDLMDLLELVCKAEDMDTPESVLKVVAQSCGGSARQALVYLSMVRDCRDPDDAAALLESPVENKDVIDLCRLIMQGSLTWDKVVGTLKRIPDMSPESVRIVVINYLAACAMSAKSEKEAARILDAMDCFSKPFNPTDKNAPLLLAFGRLVL